MCVMTLATPLLRPRVLESVHRDRGMGLPAGFLWINRYVICDVNEHS